MLFPLKSDEEVVLKGLFPDEPNHFTLFWDLQLVMRLYTIAHTGACRGHLHRGLTAVLQVCEIYTAEGISWNALKTLKWPLKCVCVGNWNAVILINLPELDMVLGSLSSGVS